MEYRYLPAPSGSFDAMQCNNRRTIGNKQSESSLHWDEAEVAFDAGAAGSENFKAA